MKRKPRLLVLNATCLDVVDPLRDWIASLGFELLADDAYRKLDSDGALNLLRDAEAVVLSAAVRTFPSAEQMQAAPNLLVCAVAASGYEWLDVDAATRNGIVVTFAPGGMGAIVVAEMTWAMMFAVARRIPYHHQRLREGDATRGMGVSLRGKTLGIVGLGNIGMEVARAAGAFNMKVISASLEFDERFVREHSIRMVSLDELLRESDFVSLHVRLNEQTRGMIGVRELALMKPTAYLINTARYELMDDVALTEAVLQNRIGGIAIDDPPTEALKRVMHLPNVVFQPHLGNRAIEGVIEVFRSAVLSAADVVFGRRPTLLVNPKVYDLPQRRKSPFAEGS